MKRTVLLSCLLLAGLNTEVLAGGDFDRMKALVGEWDTTSPEGKSRVIFQLISNGTALMESMLTENMVTVYHPDGQSVLMTHYCAAGNQPRMRAAASPGGDAISFQLVDVANLKGKEGHMQRLVIKFQDANHVTQEWTWKENGKETTTVFHLQRVK